MNPNFFLLTEVSSRNFWLWVLVMCRSFVPFFKKILSHKSQERLLAWLKTSIDISFRVNGISRYGFGVDFIFWWLWRTMIFSCSSWLPHLVFLCKFIRTLHFIWKKAIKQIIIAVLRKIKKKVDGGLKKIYIIIKWGSRMFCK